MKIFKIYSGICNVAYNIYVRANYAIKAFGQHFKGDLVLLYIGSDEYTAVINFDDSLLVKNKMVVLADIINNEVYALGYGAINAGEEFKKYELINPFEYPYYLNDKLLSESCKQRLKQLSLQRRQFIPYIIPIGMERFTRKEIDCIKRAFEAAGAKCSDAVQFDLDELYRKMGEFDSVQNAFTASYKRRAYLDEIIVDEESEIDDDFLLERVERMKEMSNYLDALSVSTDRSYRLYLGNSMLDYKTAQRAGLKEVDIIIEENSEECNEAAID